MSRRIANVGQIDRVLRDALGPVSSVRRASADGFRSDGGSGGEDQRMVDRRLRVPPLDLVLPLLQHRGLERNDIETVF